MKVVIEGVVGSYFGDIVIDDVFMIFGCVLMNGLGNIRYIVYVCIYVNEEIENDIIFIVFEIEFIL